jgi:hypothetical protein
MKETQTLASSFADAKDLADYARSGTFARGDNGIGCWGDVTAQLETPMCALPPEDIIAKYGSMKATAARGRRVKVRANGREIVCLLADRMPSRENITNNAGIDLNPAAAIHLGLTPPFLVPALWTWCA